MVYNPISCAGWVAKEGGGWVASAPCVKSRIGLVLLFFIIAIVRKWGGEEMGIEFSFLFALIGSMLPYLIVIFIFGSFKLAMIIGILGGLVGGYGAGFFFGGEEFG